LIAIDYCDVNLSPLFLLRRGAPLARFHQLRRLFGMVFDKSIQLLSVTASNSGLKLDIIRFFEILLDERRRVDPNFFGW
jgi:hypothetical protein